ncbi:asparagine synthase C-terminal domain-containing protein [Oceanobacillus kimchii]|uniref:asparagine synthase C-terminal domain-containing protein n=1 Tax=Oceanobacillus kimchii TaxID=746691 RepID=UPI0021A51FB5|nr:asparagine synthase C-terminal domain-containing protein [Oceanobacillus kimchii]MCT1578433.1 asparagine synthase C-terminal domain-containing protein [Oceanobacillus kimchii]MCT2134611.1 asparagine synthase C-terminal domain-containing protein [Oceanobacillus kimchii]
MLNKKDIESFLKLGYFLDYKNPNYSFDFAKIDKQKYEKLSFVELKRIGAELFINAISNLFENDKEHVVPLSGGLDSRAILAGLLEFTEANKISTYTFGTPGTLDFDIGNKIAKVVGTNHIEFPLTEYEYNMDEMLDISKRIDHQTVLFHHPPVKEVLKEYGGKHIWSGFLGGELTDARHTDYNEDSIEELFLKQNYYKKDSILLRNYSNENLIEDLTFKSDNDLTDYEVLDYCNRQLKFISPHVLMNGFQFKVPFLDEEVLNFFWSIDNSFRKKQILYKEILLESFPKLFSYPTKNNAGLSLNASKTQLLSKKISNRIKRKINNNVHVNYLDFNNKIREKKDMKNIVRENIYDLQNRDIISGLNVIEIFDKHINNKANFGEELLLLTSLEIHIKGKTLYSN